MKFCKITFLIVALLTVPSACSNTYKTAAIDNRSESKGDAIAVTLTPFTGQKANVKGEMPQIKIADNLKDSVEQQELPHVWLEFEQENGRILKVELDEKINTKLNAAGKALYNYQYVINNSDVNDDRFSAIYNHSLISINSQNEIETLEIDLPDGRRKLAEEEIDKIFSKQAGLINDRYYELDDHFKPKSSFYRFKQSVNKKLGYDLF